MPLGRCEAPDLRPYQRDAIERARVAVSAGKKRILLAAATGAGKTVIAAAIVRVAVGHDQRVLFVAQRIELIVQASQKLYAVGIDHGLIQAGFAIRPDERVQVASIATLHARAVRGSAMEMPRADLVIVDEAHHVRARTYRQILEAYPDSVIIGLTATPCRGDGRGLGAVFDIIIETPPVQALIGFGFLVPTKVFAPSTPDLAGVKVERGDYVEKQLAERMDKAELVGDVVAEWLRRAERRKTVVFATSVAHSVHLRDEFRRAGVLAEHIDGSTPIEERDRILRDLSAGKIEVVCNCMVLTEGWDQPDVSCIVLARPTKHMGLYRQMIGRVLRPAPGKDHALVLDHAGLTFQHGFVEEPVNWTLAGDRRAENPVHAARSEYAGTKLTTCPECSAVRTSGKPCPACGWQPRAKPAAVDMRTGDLAHVDRDGIHPHLYTVAERARWHAMLTSIARERGYKPGWAAYKFKEKFGTWPAGRFVSPITPDAECRAWVRSRQIAYAKALEKRGAA